MHDHFYIHHYDRCHCHDYYHSSSYMFMIISDCTTMAGVRIDILHILVILSTIIRSSISIVSISMSTHITIVTLTTIIGIIRILMSFSL